MISAKSRQIVSFFRRTRTPVTLTLDTLRLQRAPFVAISHDGLKLQIKPRSGESFTFYEILVRHDYLGDGITLGPGSTVVDIGANIGAFAIKAASIVGPEGRVIAFEPVPETFERLESNVAMNRLENVTCRRAAIDAQAGTLTLRLAAKSAYATAYRVNGLGEDATAEVVPCLTLGQVFDEYGLDRIHLLKVDCEGSEYGIFESLAPDLAARIDQIAMEVHLVAGHTTEELAESLRRLGFEVHGCYPWVAFNTAARRGG
jgi:FkbM family methyltransferase